jgi:type I restriction enzyme, R subunit
MAPQKLVAGLPSELVDDDQEAKQFDLLILRLQLGLLRHEKSFTRWSRDVREIAGTLEEKASIPMVRAELELIIEVQTDDFWQDITTPILENVRKRQYPHCAFLFHLSLSNTSSSAVLRKSKN